MGWTKEAPTPHDAAGIGPLGDLELKEAAAVLARGTRDNPLNIAAFGYDPSVRLRMNERFFRSVLRMDGSCTLVARDANATIIGVMRMAQPGACRRPVLKELHTAATVAPFRPRSAARLFEWQRAWEASDPMDRHWHLGPIAVEAHLLGRGIGSALLRVFCAQMDAGEESAYLQTDVKENVRFFERFGFEVLSEQTILASRSWSMLRRSCRRSSARPTTSQP